MEVGLQIFESEEFGDVHCRLDENGTAWIKAEDVARGLGFVDVHFAKSGERWESVRWARFREYISDIKQGSKSELIKRIPVPIRKGDFLPENAVYRLAMKANNDTARKFQELIADEILPSIRNDGFYIDPDAAPLQLPENVKYSTLSRKMKHLLEDEMPNLSLEMQELVTKLIKTNDEYAAAVYLIPQDLPGEVWRWIRGYEGLYQGSNKGRVKSFYSGEGRILTPLHAKGGYLRVKLTKDGKVRTLFIHRLVAKLFIPNPENKPEVHHRDDNPANNCVENLEWVTEKENSRYAKEAGNFTRGEKHHKAKLTKKQVIEIYTSYIPGSTKFGITALTSKYKVSRATIEGIIYGRTWTHATGALPVECKSKRKPAQ